MSLFLLYRLIFWKPDSASHSTDRALTYSNISSSMTSSFLTTRRDRSFQPPESWFYKLDVNTFTHFYA